MIKAPSDRVMMWLGSVYVAAMALGCSAPKSVASGDYEPHPAYAGQGYAPEEYDSAPAYDAPSVASVAPPPAAPMMDPSPPAAPPSAPRATAAKQRSQARSTPVTFQGAQVEGASVVGHGASVPEPERATEPKARLVHYDGFVRLKSTTPRETLAAAIKLNEEAGGYVEQSNERVVTLRVPVAALREVYAAVQKLGEVLARSLSAQDVTDAFTALELRIATLTASRDRLVALLARAKNEHEKLSLLREIRRLTEQVDQLTLQAQTLVKLARFSRLTLEVVPRGAQTSPPAQELAAFRWIRALSPFRRDPAADTERLELAVPEGFVELGQEERWMAESADGAIVWSMRRKNEPRGTTAFWGAAVVERLREGWDRAESSEAGGFAQLRLVDGGSQGYRYVVAVRTSDEGLDVVQIFYPNADAETRHAEAVRRALFAAALPGGAS